MRSISIILWLCLFCEIQIYGQEYSLVMTRFGMEDGLPTTEVYQVVQDRSKLLWFATDRGVSCFNGYEFKTYTTSDGLLDNSITRLLVDRNRIWCVGNNNKICYIQEGKVVEYKFNNVIQQLILDGDILNPKSRILDIAIDSNQTFYFNDRKAIFQIDSLGVVKHINPSSKQTLFALTIGDNILASINNVVSDEINKIVLYDPLNLSYKKFDKKIPFQFKFHFSSALGKTKYLSFGKYFIVIRDGELTTSIFKSHIISPYVVSQDNLWVGFSADGVKLLIGENLEEKAHLLKGYSVSSILKDHEGGVWFTTLEAGVFYVPSVKHRTLPEKLLTSSYVTHMDFSPKGKLAVGFQNGSIQLLETRKVTNIGAVRNIYSLFFLNEDVLLANSKAIYNKGNSKIFSIGPNYGFLTYYSTPYLYLGSEFRLTLEKGLWKYEKQTPINSLTIRAMFAKNDTLYAVGWEGAFRRFGDSVQNLKNVSPIFNRRFNDVSGANNKLFFASSTIGVVILEGDSVTQIGEEQGLSSNIVSCLEVEDENHIWVGTNKGLNYIDFSTNVPIIRQVTATEGLTSDEITTIKLRKDTVWVGTKHGISFFHKKDAFLPNPTLKVSLNKIWVNDSLLSVSDFPDELDYTQNRVTFQFSAISFRAGKKIDYRYRLLGLSDKWQYTRDRQIIYSALVAGNYKFEVEAGYKGKWLENSTTLSFTIQPAFWNTSWFITLSILLILSFLFGLYKMKLNKVRKQAELDRQISELKGETLKAQINPHFTFNALNSIQKFIVEQDSGNAERYLAKFGGLLRKTLDLGNQFTIPLSEELELLEAYLQLEKLRFKDKLTSQISVSDDLDSRNIQILPFLLQPFVENALLHGILPKDDGGLIQIKIYLQGDFLYCEVEDNGVGRNKKKKKLHASKGLAISQKRLKHLSEIQKMESNLLFEDKMTSDGQPAGTKVTIILPKMTQNR